MRINVYSQELTGEVNTVEKESNTGLICSAVQLMLHSSQDDDRSAITFWLPQSRERREALARAFKEMAARVLEAQPEVAGAPQSAGPKSRERRNALARAFKKMVARVREAQPETGLD